MKILKILGSPILVISLYLLIMIEGRNFGGPFILYLTIALPHGAPYAIIGILGIISLVIGYNINMANESKIKPVLYFTGIILLILSLIVFFTKEPKGNNDATFQETIPLLTICIFSISVISLLIHALMKLVGVSNNKNHRIKAAS